jgi:DNA-binding XRE family transcriptional regulator
LGATNVQDHEVPVSNRRCHVCDYRNGFRRAAIGQRDLQGRFESLIGVEGALSCGAALQLLRLLVRGSLQLSATMNKPQIITSPSGEELIVMPRRQYEDLVDALVARKAESALAAGGEELLTAEEAAALVAAPAPLAFWRKKRGKTQTELASLIRVSQNFLSDLERGKAKGDVTLYAKLARCLDVSIEDLVPEQE